MINEHAFKDKVFVISGSCQGIGKELAKQILLRNGKVVLNSRNEKNKVLAQDLLDQYQAHCHFVAADVTNSDEAESLISKTLNYFGSVDVVINNAGFSSYGLLADTSPNVIQKIIASNTIGPMLLTHFAIPHLIKSKGKILFVSSLAAFHGLPEYSLYSSSKMALTALFQSLRKELFSKSVFVGIAYVGFTENDAAKKTYSPDGKLEAVPERSSFKVASQEQTALLLLQQIRHSKQSQTHSLMGKSAFLISRFFPRLMHFLLLSNYKKKTSST